LNSFTPVVLTTTLTHGRQGVILSLGHMTLHGPESKILFESEKRISYSEF